MHREIVRDFQGKVMGLMLDQNQVVELEKFKGELEGEYKTLWVAVDKNRQYYSTPDLELKQTEEGPRNDWDFTVWKSISNERHHQISDEMFSVGKYEIDGSGKKQANKNQHSQEFENKKQLINQKTKTIMKDLKVSGFVGTDFYYSNEGKTPMASFQIAESKTVDNKKTTTWHNIKAFGKTATEMATVIGITEDMLKGTEKKFSTEKLEGVKKFTVEGPVKDDKPYTNKKGEEVTPKAIHANSFQYHRLQEISGVIAKAEQKTSKTGKEFISLYVKNNIDRGGVQQTLDYNINVYKSIETPGRKNPDGSDWSLTKGQPIAVKGEVTTNFYIKDNEVQKGEITTAWNVDRTIAQLHEQIAEKKAAKEQGQEQEQPIEPELSL